MISLLKLVTALTSLVLASCFAIAHNQANAQDLINATEGTYCWNDTVQRHGRMEYGDCVANQLSVNWNNRYNLGSYDHYMVLAIEAGADQGDLDTALINFSKAKAMAKTNWQRKEASRGLLAASVCKELRAKGWSESGSVNSIYGVWVNLTGTRSTYD